MAQPDPALPAAEAQLPPVVVKKYANRRLYNTETSSYITLDNLANMVRAGRDFAVYDAKSGDDITRGVLTQIIVEEESKGSAMLPTAFLRQLIGFYGGNLQGVVPRYLEQAMSTFAHQQVQVRQAVQQTISPFLPPGIEEMSRQNIAMIERAMSLFNPFVPPREPAPPAQADAASQSAFQSASGMTPAGDAPAEPPADTAAQGDAAPPRADQSATELERLRVEVESLRSQLAAVRADAVLARAEEQAEDHAPALPAIVSTGDEHSASKRQLRGPRRVR